MLLVPSRNAQQPFSLRNARPLYTGRRARVSFLEYGDAIKHCLDHPSERRLG